MSFKQQLALKCERVVEFLLLCCKRPSLWISGYDSLYNLKNLGFIDPPTPYFFLPKGMETLQFFFVFEQ